jgi:PHD/YefM family antitoxin component YafN of YafNO toxin-antitoxin module
MRLHPQIIEKDGKKEFVVIPYEEFLQIQAALEDLEDLREVRKEKRNQEGCLRELSGKYERK